MRVDWDFSWNVHGYNLGIIRILVAFNRTFTNWNGLNSAETTLLGKGTTKYTEVASE